MSHPYAFLLRCNGTYSHWTLYRIEALDDGVSFIWMMVCACVQNMIIKQGQMLVCKQAQTILDLFSQNGKLWFAENQSWECVKFKAGSYKAKP